MHLEEEIVVMWVNSLQRGSPARLAVKEVADEHSAEYGDKGASHNPANN